MFASPAAAALVLVGWGPLVLRMAAGVFLLIGLPVILLNAKINWPSGTRLHESLLYSLAIVMVGIIFGGLVINQTLQFLGISRPLDRVPVVATVFVVLLALGIWRPHRWRWSDGLPPDHPPIALLAIGRRDQVLIVGSVVVLIGSVAGAIRLNNDLGGGVANLTLIVAAIVLVAFFAWRDSISELTVGITVYLVSLALLLMNSLRSWLFVGGDIQYEFSMYQLTSGHGLWDVGSLREAYNACLSVTILPTVMGHITSVPDLYVFKALIQVLFALCPVLLYLIARRFASKSVAMLAIIFFIPLPMYWGDMPTMVRQEVAFFFMAVALLLITNRALSLQHRRIGFLILGAGVMLSHYSTMYVLLCTFVLARLIGGVVTFVRKVREKRQGRRRIVRHRRPWPKASVVVTWPVILLLACLTYVWIGPLTGTGGELDNTLRSTLNSLSGEQAGLRSSSTSYSVLGGGKATPEAVLQDYKDSAIKDMQDSRALGLSYPISEVEKYPAGVDLPEDMPLSGVGQAAQQMGVNLPDVKRVVAGVLAKMVQLFIGLGLLLVILGRARDFRPSREFTMGAAACVVMISLDVLLPMVSTRYDVGRMLCQGLFWLAPFLAVGAIQAFGWLGRSWAVRVASGLAITLFLLSTSCLSQLMGGEPPALHLNNAGPNYDKHYLIEQESTAAQWLQRRVEYRSDFTVQSEWDAGLIGFSTIRPSDGAYPAFIRRDGYVFLGMSTVEKGTVTVFHGGDLVAYHYPFDFLTQNKSLIYSNNAARIYR
jgi:uncharacterized membrane protein